MAELTPRERLQPSLLDRLSDDEPDSTVEPRERRVLSLRSLRAGVLRDLAWLLNTTGLQLGAAAAGLPHLASSVLHYGMPDLSGVALDSIDLPRLARGIRQAIWDFEPRLIRSSVTVTARVGPGAVRSKLGFDIEADLWAQPYPERLYLKTELDLEQATFYLTDNSARSPT